MSEDQEESRATVKFNPASGFEFDDIDGMFRAAVCYLQSGFAPSAFKTPQQLVICWARGAELGLRPLQAIDGMSVINNKIGIMGDLALAMVRSAGELADYKKLWTGEGDDLTCTVTLQRKGRDAHEYTFSVREAKQAGIYGRNPVWPQYTKRMTYYRALGFGLRDEFSDILKGLYTTEELEDMAWSKQPELPPPPVKFVDADGEPAQPTESPRQPEPAVAQQKVAQTPLEARLTHEYPVAAAMAKRPEPMPASEGVPDDINMGLPPAEQHLDQAAPEEPPFWIEHEIKGIGSFLGRTVGTLTANEMQLIESKWIPAAHKQLARATQEQLDDLKALEARIEYQKTAKPW